jgi:hypothetical protein
MMAEGAGGDSEWVVGPGMVHVEVRLGEGAELSPQATEAVENLIAALMAPEVEGFGTRSSCQPTVCGPLNGCVGFECGLGVCKPVTSGPCMALILCNIKP